MRGINKQDDGLETGTPGLFSRLTDRTDRRGFLASLGAVLGGGLGLFAAQVPANADDDDDWDDWDDDDGWDDWDDDDWDDWDDDDGWDDGYWRYPGNGWYSDDDDDDGWDDWDDYDDDDDWDD